MLYIFFCLLIIILFLFWFDPGIREDDQHCLLASHIVGRPLFILIFEVMVAVALVFVDSCG